MYKGLDFEKPLFSRAICAGTFTGFVATIVNLAYDFFFRHISGFSPSEIINVSSIIFGTMIAAVIAGLIYYFVGKTATGPSIPYIIIFAIITALCLFLDFSSNHSSEMTWLLFGLILLTGAFLIIMVPYFVINSDKLI